MNYGSANNCYHFLDESSSIEREKDKSLNLMGKMFKQKVVQFSGKQYTL